jgi:RNA polymerase sigma factor (sigma-70 family)
MLANLGHFNGSGMSAQSGLSARVTAHVINLSRQCGLGTHKQAVYRAQNVKDSREAIIDWVALHILPHEADVRTWLRRTMRGVDDVDDVIQESYCQIAQLSSVSHIRNPRAYFFTAARSIVLQRIRRDRVVRIEAVTDFDALCIVDEEPSPEQVTGARRELERVLGLIATLPTAYRQVIELRRIHGLSQKETARQLGVSERVVENNSVRGLKMILKALARDANDGAPVRATEDHEPAQLRARH